MAIRSTRQYARSRGKGQLSLPLYRPNGTMFIDSITEAHAVLMRDIARREEHVLLEDARPYTRLPLEPQPEGTRTQPTAYQQSMGAGILSLDMMRRAADRLAERTRLPQQELDTHGRQWTWFDDAALSDPFAGHQHRSDVRYDWLPANDFMTPMPRPSLDLVPGVDFNPDLAHCETYTRGCRCRTCTLQRREYGPARTPIP